VQQQRPAAAAALSKGPTSPWHHQLAPLPGGGRPQSPLTAAAAAAATGPRSPTLHARGGSPDASPTGRRPGALAIDTATNWQEGLPSANPAFSPSPKTGASGGAFAAARASLVLPHSPMAPPSPGPAGLKTPSALGAAVTSPPGLRPGAVLSPATTAAPTSRTQPPPATAAAHAQAPDRAAKAARATRAAEAAAHLARRDYEYMKLLAALRLYPATEDFVYLRAAPARAPGEWNPYALQVVPFAALARDDEVGRDYYTLSVRGLTRFVDGENAEFTSGWRLGGVLGGSGIGGSE
jgi:hypothetical protein